MYRRYRLALVLSVAAAVMPSPWALAAETAMAEQAADAMHRACRFFRQTVSCEGGYLWRYSADLTKREGEGRAGEQTVWVQPPGTPSVGMAFLEAYELTGDAECLRLARDAGYCLVRGQLRSGGWDYRIEFDPERRRRYAYRSDPPRQRARNVSTLDDNTTQAALRLLMRLDAALEFKDPAIHAAAVAGLDALLAVQYPNGAWPQRFERPPDPALYPVKRASYPDSWSRQWPKQGYSGYYTFNDNAIADTIDVMFLASAIYGDRRYAQAAERAGDFILLAQMPEPQPGWAQQYDPDMHPAWARKFEPPAITGGEAAGILRTLMSLYRQTGKRKYLEPIPRAVAYYRSSRLPEGGLARFYELKTNRPLYFTRDYQLTYDDSDMPTHYAFKVGDWVDAIAAQYERLIEAPPEPRKPARRARPPRLSKSLKRKALAVIGAMDDRGAWVENGRLRYQGAEDDTRRIIDCQTFITNLRILATCVAAARQRSN